MQQRAPLFDHLVGARLQRHRHGQTERLRGFQINHQRELSRRLYRQVARLLTLENAIDIRSRAPDDVEGVCEWCWDCSRPREFRSVCCGRRSSPIAAFLGGTPRSGPVAPDRSRWCRSRARRPDASDRPAARAPRGGHAAAAPTSSVMNWRLLTSGIGSLSGTRWASLPPRSHPSGWRRWWRFRWPRGRRLRWPWLQHAATLSLNSLDHLVG